jgi:hypothetical protein
MLDPVVTPEPPQLLLFSVTFSVTAAVSMPTFWKKLLN